MSKNDAINFYETRKLLFPFVGGIIQREKKGEKEVLMQTRWKPDRDPFYSGTLEFPAGILDVGYENIYDALEREILEETGLKLKSIINDNQTQIHSPKKVDGSFGFRPFCCVQQLNKGYPWIGFIFLCEAEEGELKAQEDEVKNVLWMKALEVKEMLENTPEKLFTLEVPAWEYYFSQS